MTESSTDTTLLTPEPSPRYIFLGVSFIAGIVLFTLSNFFYAAEFSKHESTYSLISLSLVVLGSIMFSASGFSYLSMQRKETALLFDGGNSKMLRWSIGSIIADAFFGGKRVVIAASCVYAIFFALLNGIMIYLPNVDFYHTYAVNGPALRVVTCCGPPGYVPIGLLYLPAQHAGLQLIPLSIVIMLLVSVMVGLNVALLTRSFSETARSRAGGADGSGKKGAAGSVVGAAFGLFAGCPTCATTLFLPVIAGGAATIFSAAISEYQPVIIALTLPLLFASAYWQARSVKTVLERCAI